MFSALLLQVERIVEGPVGRARRMVPFPQGMSVPHPAQFDTDPGTDMGWEGPWHCGTMVSKALRRAWPGYPRELPDT